MSFEDLIEVDVDYAAGERVALYVADKGGRAAAVGEVELDERRLSVGAVRHGRYGSRGDDAGESVLIFGTVKDDGKLILGAELAAGAFARPLSLREFEFYSLML